MCDKSTILFSRENIDTIVNIYFFKYVHGLGSVSGSVDPFFNLTNPDSVQGHTFRSGVYTFLP